MNCRRHRMTSNREDRTQPRRRIAGYPNTLKREGGARVWPHVISLADTSSPVFASSSIAADEADLSRIGAGAPRALGQLITVSGHVLDESGRPIRRCLIEVW